MCAKLCFGKFNLKVSDNSLSQTNYLTKGGLVLKKTNDPVIMSIMRWIETNASHYV